MLSARKKKLILKSNKKNYPVELNRRELKRSSLKWYNRLLYNLYLIMPVFDYANLCELCQSLVRFAILPGLHNE